MIRLYGLTKCSTCLKARKWLDRHKVPFEFVDYREYRVAAPLLKNWAAQLAGFAQLVNRSGTTWRNLPPNRKAPASDAEWLLLIGEYPALVRRPIVVRDGVVSLGYSDKTFSAMFGKC